MTSQGRRDHRPVVVRVSPELRALIDLAADRDERTVEVWAARALRAAPLRVDGIDERGPVSEERPVRVRLDADELTSAEAQAARHGLSVSAWCRRVLARAAARAT